MIVRNNRGRALNIYVPAQAQTNDVCSCECCTGKRCAPSWNTTASVNACNACTPSFCSQSFAVCQAAPEVTAKCISTYAVSQLHLLHQRIRVYHADFWCNVYGARWSTDRNSAWNKVTIILLLVCVSLLLMVGCLKDCVRVLSELLLKFTLSLIHAITHINTNIHILTHTHIHRHTSTSIQYLHPHNTALTNYNTPPSPPPLFRFYFDL